MMNDKSHYFSEIIYAGHSAIFLNGSNEVVAIDPWLMGNPLCPENLKMPEKIDVIVLSHGHADHADDALRLGKHYGAKLYAIFELAMLLINEGYPKDQVIGMNKGGTAKINDQLSISLTHALHSNSYETAHGSIYAGEACGVIVSTRNCNFYHAGDTALFSDMALIGKMYKPKYAFLPCGDLYTMDPIAAAQAASLVGAEVNIPIHHSTFPALTGTPWSFKDECKKLRCEAIILQPGEHYAIT
jgi:L-ascorbate metabolism protein UlaG (beta-lactamase superfamily)